MITEELFDDISKGRDGRNWGLPLGLPKLEGIIDGVTKSTYTLLFGPTSSAKTSLALYAYIYNPLKDHLDDDKYEVVYFSLEMSAKLLFAKLLSLHIFETYGVEISTKELLSRKKDYTLSEEYFSLVQESLEWLKKVESKVTVYDKGLTAKSLYADLIRYLQDRGEFSESGNRKIYIPKNPDKIITVVIDHISLCRPSEGRKLKEEIDTISAYLVTLRNICGISPLVLMQANRESSSMDRRKENMSNLTVNDTKDSGNPPQDSEVMISIFNPNREKLNTYRGYNIKSLEDNFRTLTVLKSRFGECNVEIGTGFYGKAGIFAELPKPDEISDYEKYTSANWLLGKEEDNSNKSNFNFVV